MFCGVVLRLRSLGMLLCVLLGIYFKTTDPKRKKKKRTNAFYGIFIDS